MSWAIQDQSRGGRGRREAMMEEGNWNPLQYLARDGRVGLELQLMEVQGSAWILDVF